MLYRRQGDARWERRCTTDKHRRARATGCMAGNEMHDGRGVARLASVCPDYFCLGGALRGYILSITSIGTPRIRCNCLFVAE